MHLIALASALLYAGIQSDDKATMASHGFRSLKKHKCAIWQMSFDGFC